MADRPEYKSIWTGQQVDDAVGKIIGNGVTPLTTGDIVQTEGTSPTKVMSQAAVTNAIKNVDPSEKINEAIDEHNVDEQAHQYIQGLVNAKPNALNDRSDSQKDTYSANYINNSFAPITFVSNLYAQRVNDNTADLVDSAPELSSTNLLVSTDKTNTDYDWNSPEFTFTRDLEVPTTLTSQNSFALNLTFQTSRNATISWGARIKVSQDNGSTWTYISDNQAYGAIFYETGIGNTAIFNVFTNTIQGAVTYPIGTLLAIEIYKKQTSATPLTTTIYCGVEVDNAGIYTYAQFNFANVNIGTNQLEDGSVTFAKLNNEVQEAISKKGIMKLVGTQENPINFATSMEKGGLYSCSGWVYVENAITKTSDAAYGRDINFYQRSQNNIAQINPNSSLLIYKYTDNYVLLLNSNIAGNTYKRGTMYQVSASYYEHIRFTFDTTTGAITATNSASLLKSVNGDFTSDGFQNIYAPNTAGVEGQILQSNGEGNAPTWVDNTAKPQLDGKTIGTNNNNELQAIGLINGDTVITAEEVLKALTIERTV